MEFEQFYQHQEEPEEPTPYQDNRAFLLDRVMRDTRNLESAVALSGGPITVEWYDLRGTEHSTQVDPQLLSGMHKVIVSLKQDLVRSGPIGNRLCEEIVYDVNKPKP